MCALLSRKVITLPPAVQRKNSKKGVVVGWETCSGNVPTHLGMSGEILKVSQKEVKAIKTILGWVSCCSPQWGDGKNRRSTPGLGGARINLMALPPPLFRCGYYFHTDVGRRWRENLALYENPCQFIPSLFLPISYFRCNWPKSNYFKTISGLYDQFFFERCWGRENRHSDCFLLEWPKFRASRGKDKKQTSPGWLEKPRSCSRGCLVDQLTNRKIDLASGKKAKGCISDFFLSLLLLGMEKELNSNHWRLWKIQNGQISWNQLYSHVEGKWDKVPHSEHSTCFFSPPVFCRLNLKWYKRKLSKQRNSNVTVWQWMKRKNVLRLCM